MDLAQGAVLMLAGTVAGAANGIAGGGSLISFPTLIAVGLPPVAANVTNSVGVFPGNAATVAGSYSDLRTLAAQWGPRRLVALLPTVTAGTVVGCYLLLLAPARAFDLVIPFLVLAAAGVLAARDQLRGWIGHPRDMSPRRRTALIHTVVGVVCVYGGYFGAAMGVILISTLAVLVEAPLARVSALKNAIATFCGLVTVVVFAVSGPVHWAAAGLVAGGGMAGGYMGSRLARVIPAVLLRRIIVGYATLLGGYLLYAAL